MFKTCVAALNEASDITLHLMPLVSHFKVCNESWVVRDLTCSPVQAFETTDFTDVRPLFPPLLHTICLVYSSSKYYNTSARIIVLLTVSSVRRKDRFQRFSVSGNLQHAN